VAAGVAACSTKQGFFCSATSAVTAPVQLAASASGVTRMIFYSAPPSWRSGPSKISIRWLSEAAAMNERREGQYYDCFYATIMLPRLL
jgi:hypothetical protein